jgi:hypothetical protein
MKGATPGFVPDLMILALETEEPLNKNELFKTDEYAL